MSAMRAASTVSAKPNQPCTLTPGALADPRSPPSWMEPSRPPRSVSPAQILRAPYSRQIACVHGGDSGERLYQMWLVGFALVIVLAGLPGPRPAYIRRS